MSVNEWAWWQKGIVYQIYPMSFQDSDQDGYGDLQGIIDRLDYLQSLNVDALWLSPVYPSPLHDNGYDVADYCGIHPLFGDLETFDRLLEEVHAAGMKLLMDLVPNHTSDEHHWFLESRSSRDNPKRDWYIWHDPGPEGGPPNNWLSHFGGPAWTLDEASGQYYLHQFDTHQPELNYRHPDVLPAMQEVMRFWLDRGVDGFRVDVIYRMVKDELFRDEPANPDWDGIFPFQSLIHCRTQDLAGTQKLVAQFRKVVDEYSDRVMVGEVYLPLDRLVRYYGRDLSGCHLPFNFHLLLCEWKASAVRRLVEEYESLLPPGGWPNWVASNHDRPRSATRVTPRQARVSNMLLLTLRGTPTVYYAEELGHESVDIPADVVRDPISLNLPELANSMGRDQARTPMPWDGTCQAGFTRSAEGPWLPLTPDYETINVAAQQERADSHLNLFRALTRLRRQAPALSVGDYSSLDTPYEEVFAFLRTHPGSDSYLICLNFGPRDLQLDVSCCGARAEIAVSSSMKRRGVVDLSGLDLAGAEGLLLRLCGPVEKPDLQ